MRIRRLVALFAAVGLACAATARAEVQSREVQYAAQGVTMKGFLAWDDAAKEKRPGVLVVHEWWGHNEYARRRALMLAALGYTALAVDMYGDGKTAAHPEDATKFSGELMKNAEVTRARFLAAEEFIKAQPQTDAARIAAVGYCMGGGVALNMARAGEDLKGVASFHGSLNAIIPAKKGAIKAKLLVLHGADDKFIPPEAVEAFKQEMASAGATMKFIAYPGALHSFTNPDADLYAKKFGMPIAYNAEADAASWAELTRFLADVLK
jgi:dienelactone hydrolase